MNDRSRRRTIFVILALASCLTLLDQSQITVALPRIQSDFGARGHEVQLLVTGYALSYALFLLPAGRLGDRFTPRRMLLIALVILITAGVFAAIAPSMSTLILARVAQGAGAGLLMPQVLGVLQLTFPPAERMRPMALLSSFMAIPIALAPSYGGVVLELAGGVAAWRVLFVTPVVVDAVVFAAAFILLRPTHRGAALMMDWTGIFLLAPALAGVVIPLTAGIAVGEAPLAYVVLGIMGIVATAAFVAHLRRRSARGRVSLIEIDLLRDGTYRRGVIVAGLSYGTTTASTLSLGLFLQQGAGLTPLIAALCLLPNAVGVGVSSWAISRRSAADSARLVRSGTIVTALAIGILAGCLALDNAVLTLVATPILLLSLGAANGWITAPNQTRTLGGVPDDKAGSAAALLQLSQRVGTAIGGGAALAAYYAFDTGGGSRAGLALALAVGAALILIARGVAAR